MIKPAEGWEKRALDETTHVLVPHGLKAEVEALVAEYRAKFVEQAVINRNMFNSQAAIARDKFDSQTVIDREQFDSQALIDRNKFYSQTLIDRNKFDSQALIDRDRFISKAALERQIFNSQAEEKRDEFDYQAVAKEEMFLSTFFSEGLGNLDAAIARLEEALLLKDNASLEIKQKIREALKLLRTVLKQGS